MAGNTESSRARIDREATDWMIRLQEEPGNDDLRQAFDTWLQRSPEHADAWAATRHTALLIEAAAPAEPRSWQAALDEMRGQTTSHQQDAAFAANDAPPTGAEPRAAQRRPRRLRVAGLAIAACLLALVVGPHAYLHMRADYTTDTAETRDIQLSDDSVVTLAPESAISVHYSDGERHIDLLRGEAFFEVTPVPTRPFRVSSHNTEVTVLGTGFNVLRRDLGTAVSVEHGRVRVDPALRADATEVLTTGQTVTVRDAQSVERGMLPTGQIAAWRRHQLIAQDQPLGDVVDRLRRYFPGRIVVTDDALAGQPVTGVYNLKNPVGALRGIARAQQAVVREITPWLLLVSAS
ncbi:FecR family protein [Marinobacter sp. JSM 1782161]|uniref:FecR family protein n=1 Tax=Marinobacter sp. JSM 1782161 TaxID=2685906 RepID=UPI0014032430|nr:FecR domain-containing protein [Marinobacter sp. JSM 1782161]